MAAGSQPGLEPIRFGVFELDSKAGELRKNGRKLRIEGQPLQILALLLEKPGQVVTREELKQKLWAEDTFVDFEHGINTGIRRLREALDDSAETPRFIETLPRRGYRFICPISSTAAPALPEPWWRQSRVLAPSLGVLALAALLLFSNIGGLRDRMLGRPAPGEIKAIAVLPLRNISGDAEQDHFAVAFTEMFITELGRVGALRVPSHQTVLQYAGTKKSLPEIARELQVDALIEGTVLRAGNRVRITINFVQAQPERHLLSEKYDRDLSDVLSVQDDVTRAVTGKIRSSLTPELRRHFAKSRSLDAEANETYVKALFLSGPSRGRQTYESTSESDRAKAYEYFQKVLQKEPDFAPAYARMALLDAHGGAYRGAGGQGRSKEVRAKARQLALKALELDDTLAEPYVALAWLEFWDWDFAGAEREFKRAIELNPNLTVARIWYISYLTCLRRFEDADAESEAVLQLDPASSDTLTHVANHYLFSGRLDKAIALYRQALDLEPGYGGGHWGLGRTLYVQGNYQESIAELEKAIAERGRTPMNLAVIAAAYIKVGRRKEGLEVIGELEERGKERGGGGGGAMAAYPYIALGDKDKALNLLERSFDRGGMYVMALLGDPLYEPLRSDPRFQDLARRIGFPPDTLRRAGIPTEGPSGPQPAPAATAHRRASR